MIDKNKTKEQLINELVNLRQRIAEREKSDDEHKKVEEALRKSELRFRTLVEKSLDAIFLINFDMEFVFWNHIAEKMMGLTTTPTKIITLSDVLTPDSLKVAIENVTKAAETGTTQPHPYELKVRKFDGTLTVMEVFIGLVEYEGKTHMLGTARDITERKQVEEALRESEERFRVLVEESPLGVSVIGKDGRYKYVNPKFIQIFGYTLEDIPAGREWFKKAYPDKEYRNQVVSSWIDDLKDIKSGESRPQTFTVKCKDGSEKVIIFRPVTMKAGDQFVVYTDITDRKRLESQLQQAQKMEAIGTLAGGIAHDFNNMLTSVLGNISVAQMDTEPGGKVFELLTEAEKSAKRAKDLTARLITFSKGGEPFKQKVSIGEFVKESVNSMLEGSSIHCEFTIPDDLWAVNIDERQMKQVVHNIVINAMEVMKGKGEINVYCENVDIREKDVLALEAGKYARISIKDQGVGIPQKNLTKIFDPYFSTKEMGTQKGMGLGLAVCHSIVKKHDGLITVESHVNVGSTFHIYLPALSAESKEQRTEHNDVAAVEKPVVGKGKILVMDDEETVRGVTAAMLNKFGYEVEVAVEGSEAIEMYKKAKESDQSYDGVILDLTNKIGMGGVEAIKRLLEIDPEIRAIIATGYSTDPIVTKFKEYGFCGALTKPFGMDELRKTILGVIERD